MEYESSINNVYIKKIFVKLYKCYVEMSAIKEFKWNFFFQLSGENAITHFTYAV